MLKWLFQRHRHSVKKRSKPRARVHLIGFNCIEVPDRGCIPPNEVNNNLVPVLASILLRNMAEKENRAGKNNAASQNNGNGQDRQKANTQTLQPIATQNQKQ